MQKEFICQHCGTTFTRRYRRNRPQLYCSTRCGNLGRQTNAGRKSGLCEVCGKQLRGSGFQRWCRTCAPDRKTRQRLKDHRLSQEQYDALLTTQRGLCAICREKPPIVVDHDHATGVVRGLLCHACNFELGVIERPGWLRKANAYLNSRRHLGQMTLPLDSNAVQQ